MKESNIELMADYTNRQIKDAWDRGVKAGVTEERARWEEKLGSKVAEIERGNFWYYAEKPDHAISPRDLLEDLKPGTRLLVLAPKETR